MKRIVAATAGLLLLGGTAGAYEVSKYYVMCINSRITVEQFDLAQMKVRHGSNVCQFSEFTSVSSAESFAEKNFGGKGKSCTCG